MLLPDNLVERLHRFQTYRLEMFEHSLGQIEPPLKTRKRPAPNQLDLRDPAYKGGPDYSEPCRCRLAPPRNIRAERLDNLPVRRLLHRADNPPMRAMMSVRERRIEQRGMPIDD